MMRLTADIAPRRAMPPMTRLPIPGRIMVFMLSNIRRRRKPAMRTAIARPVTGNQPKVSVKLNTAVTSASVVEKTNSARID